MNTTENRWVLMTVLSIVLGTLVLGTLAGCAKVEQVGTYEVQRNDVSGTLKLKEGDSWIESVKEDPSAANAAKEAVAGVTFSDITWGEKGILCAKAHPKQTVSGKVSLMIEIYDKATNKRLRDKSVRVAVEWPAGKETPSVLNTTLATPEVKDTFTKITAEPILSTD
jgi:hypothetical protein